MSTEQRPPDQLRIVIDTNVLVSGLNFPGNERRVLELGRRGEIEVYLSPFILDELRGILQRKFGQTEAEAEENIQLILQWGKVVHPTATVTMIERNDKDNRILECCLEVRAQYLVTGDRRDLLPLQSFHGTRIVNAAEFLVIVRTV